MAHSEDFEFKQNALSPEGKRRWDDIFKKDNHVVKDGVVKVKKDKK
jgi:hypothetical protein